MTWGWDNLISLLSEGLVKNVFGSPELAGIFFLGLIIFLLVKMGVSFDGIAVIVAITILSLSVSGVFSFGFLFLPLVIGMLAIIGMAMIKIFRK